MAPGVVPLDVLELRGVVECGHAPVEMTDPLVDGGEAAADVTDVALEMLDVYWVEADDGGEQADVGFGDGVAEVVWVGLGGEVGFDAREGGEEWGDGRFVGFLCSVMRVRGENCVRMKGR